MPQGGFPNRIARSSFGPTLESDDPVVNPKQDIGPDTFNLDYWQVAGMNVVSPRGLLQVTAEVGGATTEYQGFAWDSEILLPKIIWTRTQEGEYTFSLPETEYLDSQNNLVTVEFIGGQAIPQATSVGDYVLGQFELTGVRSGRVSMFVPQQGIKKDINFLLQLW